jgi:predicted permease
MLAIAAIILPVFLIVGSGYGAVRLFGFSEAVIDGVMTYAIRFAVPVLLFRAVYALDLGQAFDWRLLLAFYGGAFVAYATAILLARRVWRRRPGEAAAIGFCALFSNTLMLGLAVLERSYGAPSLPYGFMILALHSPTVYFVGIVVMEFARRDGAGPVETLRRATRAMLGNNLMVGIGIGFAFNLAGLTLPEPLLAAVDQIAASALPASLFAMGGALTRYSLRADIGIAAMVASLSLLAHPAIAALIATGLALPTDMARAAVVLAAMPTGMNGYLFAAMYNRAMGAAASAVLLATTLSVFSIGFWLWWLGGVPG